MNERQIIEYIAAGAGAAGGQVLMGIGDDCAVIRKAGDQVWLLTMDTLIEGVHFDYRFHPPGKLGRKVVSVNVSDIGAMGGAPSFALLSVGMPDGFDTTWFKAFSQGLAEACREYGCLLVGGDTVASPLGCTFSLTVIGEARAEEVVYRSGARIGDTIWVSGELGLAAAGLELLQKGIDAPHPVFDRLRERHLNPRARCQLGRRLGTGRLVTAMMDLSDGLATDLAHLCARSGVGARISEAALPGISATAEAAGLVGADAVAWAISGGEDYELLFTAPPGHQGRLQVLAEESDIRLTAIGSIVAAGGVVLVGGDREGRLREVEIAYQGYDHFRNT